MQGHPLCGYPFQPISPNCKILHSCYGLDVSPKGMWWKYIPQMNSVKRLTPQDWLGHQEWKPSTQKWIPNLSLFFVSLSLACSLPPSLFLPLFTPPLFPIFPSLLPFFPGSVFNLHTYLSTSWSLLQKIPWQMLAPQSCTVHLPVLGAHQFLFIASPPDLGTL